MGGYRSTSKITGPRNPLATGYERAKREGVGIDAAPNERRRQAKLREKGMTKANAPAFKEEIARVAEINRQSRAGRRKG